MENSYIPPEYAAQLAQLQRQKALAEMLSQRALAPQGTQVVTGHAVRNAPLGNIARALTAFMGNRQAGQADEGLQGVLAQAMQARQQAMQGAVANPEQGQATLDPVVRALAQSSLKRRDERFDADRTFGLKEREFDFDQERFKFDKTYKTQTQDRLERELTDAIKRGDQAQAARLEQIKQGWARIGLEREELGYKKSKLDSADTKPMPTAALRLQNEEIDAIQTAKAINQDLGAVRGQIKDGKLNLGLVENLLSKGKNYAGISDQNSRNYASFNATLEKLRNDSLRLNKGVQTEGDAVRAWNELFSNINDKDVVSQRLEEIERINDRAAGLRKVQVELLRSNFNQPPLTLPDIAPVTPALQGGESLPPGVKRIR